MYSKYSLESNIHKCCWKRESLCILELIFFRIWMSVFFYLCLQIGYVAIGTKEKISYRGRGKIPQKNLFHKKIHIIWSRINILQLLFTFFICLRDKKLSLWLWKQSHFCVKRIVLIGIQLIKEYKPIANGLIMATEAISQDLR